MEFLININDYFKPLRELSFDKDHNVSLIESEDCAYSLDAMTKYVYKKFHPGKTASSCDALKKQGEDYCLIEFKNQKQSSVRKDELFKKAFDSFQIFRLLVEQTWSVDETVNHLKLFVVFRDKEPGEGFAPLEGKLRELSERTEEPVYFGLQRFQGKFYKEVHTITAGQFLALLKGTEKQ